MRLSTLEAYNKTADEPLKNARNAAAGALRNLDPAVTARRKLDAFFYQIGTIENPPRDHITEYRPAICRGNAMGNTNLWRFFMPCRGYAKLYEYGWEIPCFFACGRRKRGRPYPFPHGRPGGDMGAQTRRNEHFSKSTEGGIQHGGIPH